MAIRSLKNEFSAMQKMEVETVHGTDDLLATTGSFADVTTALAFSSTGFVAGVTDAGGNP